MTNGLKRDDSSGLQMSPFLSGGHLQRRLQRAIDRRCNIAENTLIQSRQWLRVTTFDCIRNNCKREKKAEGKLLNSSARCCQLKRPQLMRNNYAALPSDFSAFMINAGLLTSHKPQQKQSLIPTLTCLKTQNSSFHYKPRLKKILTSATSVFEDSF